jgi:hypothetical protein
MMGYYVIPAIIAIAGLIYLFLYYLPEHKKHEQIKSMKGKEISELKVFFSTNPPRFIPLKIKMLIVLFESIRARRFLSVIAGFILAMGIFVNKVTDIRGILEIISIVSLAMTPFWLSLMVYCIVKGLKTNRLLQHGYTADAQLKSKQETNILIKGEGYINKMTFQFKTSENLIAETTYKTAHTKSNRNGNESSNSAYTV